MRKNIAIAATVAIAASLVACSGDTGVPGNESGGSAVQGISDDKVIKVGGFIAQSGPLAVISSIKKAAELRFDKINEAGGVNGYTFDYVAIDDQADPSKTVSAVKQLWETEKVFSLFLPYGSGANNAAKTYVLENEIPLAFPFSDSRIYFEHGVTPPSHVFGFLPPYEEFIKSLIVFADGEKSVQKIAVVHTNDDTGQSGSDALAALAPELGLEIVADIGYDGTETNFAPIGRRAAESGADAILLWALAGSTEILESTEQAGYDGIWMGQDAFRGGIYLDALKKIPALEDRFFINAYLTPPSDGGDDTVEFVDAFTEAYPNDDVLFSQPGWVAASMYIEAVERATADGSDLTWEKMVSALEQFDDETISGAHGITYNAGAHFGITKAAVRSFNGKDFETVTPFELLPGFK